MEGRAVAGALGPRLVGRLTAELILRSPQYMSCVKDYEIDLRGMRSLAYEAKVEIMSRSTTVGHVLQGISCPPLKTWEQLRCAWLSTCIPGHCFCLQMLLCMCTCTSCYLCKLLPLCSTKQSAVTTLCQQCSATSAEPV